MRSGARDRGASRSRMRASMKKVNQSLARTKKQTVSTGFKVVLFILCLIGC